MATIRWTSKKTPAEIQTALKHLAVEYPLVQDGQADINLHFHAISGTENEYTIQRNGSDVVIHYSSLSAAMRAVGTILADIDIPAEKTSFGTLGIMLCCSQNAVMKIDYLKHWLRKLALMGYNRFMLDTDDIYQLPDEPYFGYLRGTYSPDELREIDQYAGELGIEMIACFQTLGHFGTVLKWDVYQHIRDTNEIMLVGEERTYQLIEKMLQFWSSVYSSRQIHLGMDESHKMGSGRYLDIHGYKPRNELFIEHLDRVNQLCKKYGLKPMIWSDMYFRNASKTRAYYDKDIVFTDELKAKVSKDTDLVYWDYYHDDETFYAEWIDRHRQLGSEPIMAGGIWTWRTLWYNRRLTETTMKPCIDACKKKNVKDIFFTMWGDDGGYCDFDSAMTGLAWAAEEAWNTCVSQHVLNKRFAAICHADYDECLVPCGITEDSTIHEKEIWGKDILWDDPILGILWRQVKLQDATLWTRTQQKYCQMMDRLERCKTQTTEGGDLNYAKVMLRFLHDKIQLKIAIDEAYQKRDKCGMESLIANGIPALIQRLEEFDLAFRTQWLRRNKHYGLEVMQIRFAGQKRRWQELAMVLREFIDGKVDQIPDLEVDAYAPLPYYPKKYQFLATSAVEL